MNGRDAKQAVCPVCMGEGKLWCAMCGTWGNHRSGGCPELVGVGAAADDSRKPSSADETAFAVLADEAGSGGSGRSLETVEVADCIEFMAALPDACVDAVITDLPYGTTSNRWDTVIDLPAWWLQVRRLCRGAVVTTASQPFTAQMVMSNVEEFRHEWVWRKNRGSNFANTVREPFKEHESVVVFAAGKWTYNAQRETRRGAGADRANYKCTFGGASENYRKFEVRKDNELTVDRVPSSVQDWNTETGLHPTQKPIEMMRYLVRTYTNPGDVVLDMCCGSGTTLLAAKQEGRHYLGCDREAKYVEIARGRLASEFFLGGGGAEQAGDDNATTRSRASSHTDEAERQEPRQ